MAKTIADNLLYNGKKPLDARAQFDTVLSMKEFNKDFLPEGFITFCLEDKKNYKFTNNNWEEYNPKTEEYYGYYTTLYPIEDYAYEVYYNELNYPLAYKRFAEDNIPEFAGGCSSVRVGNMYGRNLDWLYNEQAEFVLHTPSAGGRYATTCTCGQVTGLTDEFVKSLKYSEDYVMLPFYCVDGINEKGVFINVNVVPAEKGNTETFIEPTISKEVEICANMIPRYVLDNFASASEAVAFIQEHMRIYFSKKLKALFGYEPHFMIGDRDSTYIVEFANNEVKVYDCDMDLNGRSYMTNFHLTDTEFNATGAPLLTPATAGGQSITDVNKLTPDAAGIERYNLIEDLVKNEAPVRYIMDMLMYTKAYTANGLTDKWYTEFVGTPVTPGGTDYVNIDSSLADFETIWTRVNGKFPNRTRNPQDPNPDAFYGSWQTTHSVVYNLDTMEAEFIFQENTDEIPYIITLEIGGGSGIDEFNATEGTYLVDLPDGIFKLKILGEEVGLCVKKEGGVQLITGAHDRYCRALNRSGARMKVKDLMEAYDTRTNVHYDDWYQQIDYNDYLRLLSNPTTRPITQLEGGNFPEGMLVSFISEFDNESLVNIGIDNSSRFLIMDVDGPCNWEKPFKIKKGERYSFYFHKPESEDPYAPGYFYYIGNKGGIQDLSLASSQKIETLPTGVFNAIIDGTKQGTLYVDNAHKAYLIGKDTINSVEAHDNRDGQPIACVFDIESPNTEVFAIAEGTKIDWGDGTPVQDFTWDPHTYVKPGTYKCVIYDPKTTAEPIGTVNTKVKYINVPATCLLEFDAGEQNIDTVRFYTEGEPVSGFMMAVGGSVAVKRIIIDEFTYPGYDEYYIIAGFNNLRPYPGCDSIDVFILPYKEALIVEGFTDPECDVNIYLKDEDFEAQKASMIANNAAFENPHYKFAKMSTYTGNLSLYEKFSVDNIAIVDDLITTNKPGKSLEDRVTVLENTEPSGGDGLKRIDVTPTTELRSVVATYNSPFIVTMNGQDLGLAYRDDDFLYFENASCQMSLALSNEDGTNYTVADLINSYNTRELVQRNSWIVSLDDEHTAKLQTSDDAQITRLGYEGHFPNGMTVTFVPSFTGSINKINIDGRGAVEIANGLVGVTKGNQVQFYYYKNPDDTTETSGKFYQVKGEGIKTIEVQPTDLLKDYADGTFIATYGGQAQGLVVKSSQGVTLVNGEGVRRMDYVVAASATESRDATAQDLLLAYPQTSMGYRSDFVIEAYDQYYGTLKIHRPSDMANMRPNIVGSPPIKDGYTFSIVAAGNYSGVSYLQVDGQKHEIAPQSINMYADKEYTFYYHSNLFYCVNGQALSYKVTQTYAVMQEDDPSEVKYYVPYIDPNIMMSATLLCKDGRSVVIDYESDDSDPISTSGAYIITSATIKNLDDQGKVIDLIINDPANKTQLLYEFYLDSGDYEVSEISTGGGETVDLTPFKKAIRDIEAIIPPANNIGEQYGDGAPQFSFYWNNKYYVIFAMADSDWRGIVYVLQEYNSPTDQEYINREQFNFGDNNYQYIAGVKQIGGRVIIYGSAYDRGMIARSPIPQGPDDSLLNYTNVMASWSYYDVSSDSGMNTILDVVDIGCEPGNRYSHWLGMIGQYYPFYYEQRTDQIKMTMCRFNESSEDFELRDLTDNSLYYELPFRHFKLLLHPNWNWQNLNQAFIIASWGNRNDDEGSSPTYVYSGGLNGSMNRQLIYGPAWGVSVVDHDFVMCCETGDYEKATMVYVPLPEDPAEYWPDDDDCRFYNLTSQIDGVPFLYTDRYLLVTPPYDDPHATLYYIDENKALLVGSIPTEKITTRDGDNIFKRPTRLEIDNDGSIYMYIAAGDSLYVHGKHLNMVRTIKGSNRLATDAKDIVGAINELAKRIAEIERRL